MYWKYERSKIVYEVDWKFKRFYAYLASNGDIRVPSYFIQELAEVLELPELKRNCVFVVELQGMMLPPKQWVRIETRKDQEDPTKGGRSNG